MPSKTQRRPRLPRLSMGAWLLVALLVLIAGYLAVLQASRPSFDGTRLRLDQFQLAVDRDEVLSATFLDADGVVMGEYRLSDQTRVAYHVPYFRDEARQTLANSLVRARVPTTVDQQVFKAVFVPGLLLLFPTLMIIVIFAFLILLMRRGTELFGVRSGARRFDATDAAVGFADVAGQPAAVEEMREVAQLLSDAERFAAVGSTLPKGILLFGPPGCGKTLLARALAHEAGAAFFSISGSDFVEVYVGVGAARVRDLFREAREHTPAIVFIDELDSLARHRGSGSTVATTSMSEQEHAVNQLLAEMDGFSPSAGVLVVGATNRPDTLDPALLRPGRFDRSVALELPDLQGRQAILGVHVRSRPLAPEVDIAAIAERAVGMTGADLAGVVNEAGLLAGRAGRTTISQADLITAVDRQLEAPERQRRLSMRDRSIGQRTVAEDRVTFADVAGVPEAVQELREIRDYLSAPDRFAAVGARIPRGFLLAGPPGCGKTLLARAVAGEAHATFISASGSEFVMRYVGEGAQRVRDLFAEARAVAPAVLFIDEIDAVGSTRGPQSHEERHQTLNQILVELDGFSPRAGIVVIAATNRPDRLDSALVRPGRFDRQVFVSLPDAEGRRAILGVHAAGKPLAADVDLAAVARLTPGLSGADLANVINEAALLAARGGGGRIEMRHLDEAIERAALGIGGARTLSPREKEITAYHEAGHGLVALAYPNGRVLHKLTIVPRGASLGGAWIGQAEDRLTWQRSALMEEMAILVGGKITEELVFGESSTGAQSDLLRVAGIARRMVGQLGMSDAVGALNHLDLIDGEGRNVHSEHTAQLIDGEARRLVETAEAMARAVVQDSREALDRVAQRLIETETLRLDEVEALVRAP